VEFLSIGGTERAIEDSATDLRQEIGATVRIGFRDGTENLSCTGFSFNVANPHLQMTLPVLTTNARGQSCGGIKTVSGHDLSWTLRIFGKGTLYQ
jgi:hypothetical protein